jgi:NADH-quinone oxidoreductase subunit C
MSALTSEQIHQRLAARFGGAIGALSPPKKDAFCTFAADRIVEICQFMKSDRELAFDFLEDLTATDHPKENLIRVVYHFYSYPHRHSFIAKAEVNRQTATIATLENVWKAANWLEREVFDLFGVIFKGHSDHVAERLGRNAAAQGLHRGGRLPGHLEHSRQPARPLLEPRPTGEGGASGAGRCSRPSGERGRSAHGRTEAGSLTMS